MVRRVYRAKWRRKAASTSNRPTTPKSLPLFRGRLSIIITPPVAAGSVQMSEDDLKRDRRSTRLSISIPVVISGVDADGNNFGENVRTLVVNKHGGKIATNHHLAMGTEVLIENPALGVTAKAGVVWLGGKHYPGDFHHVGLQLFEAQNVWGIAFPPDDWMSAPREEAPPAPEDVPASEQADPVSAEAPASSLAGEEITIRLLQELQQSADAHAQEFQDRLKQLTQRLGLEFEFDLRERAAHAKAREVGILEEEIKALRESLSACKRGDGKARSQNSGTAMRSRSRHGTPANTHHTLRGGTPPAHCLGELGYRKHEPCRRGRPERIPEPSPERKSAKCGAAAPGHGR